MEEYIECKICGCLRKQLGTHLKMHNLTSKQYLDMFPDAPLMSEARKNKNKNKEISPNNIEHWLKKGFSEEEAKIKIIETRKKNSLGQKNGGSCRTLEYWLKKGFSEEEAKIKIIEIQSTNTLEKYITKYGVYGEKVWLERQKEFGYKQSSEYLLSKGYNEEEIREFKDNTSLEYQVKKHGYEKGKLIYNDFISKCKSNSKRCISFWHNLGFIEEESKQEVAKFQSRDIEFWKNKYPNDWKQRRNEWITKATQSSNRWSKESIVFFDKLISKLNEFTLDYIFFYKEDEEMVEVNNNIYYIDMTLYINNKKIAIEYFGDYWHANPLIFEKNDIVQGKKVIDIWKHDEKRMADIMSLGYRTYTVYSSDDFENKIQFIIKDIFEN